MGVKILLHCIEKCTGLEPGLRNGKACLTELQCLERNIINWRGAV